MVWIVVAVYLLTSRLTTLQRLVNLKVHSNKRWIQGH